MESKTAKILAFVVIVLVVGSVLIYALYGYHSSSTQMTVAEKIALTPDDIGPNWSEYQRYSAYTFKNITSKADYYMSNQTDTVWLSVLVFNTTMDSQVAFQSWNHSISKDQEASNYSILKIGDSGFVWWMNFGYNHTNGYPYLVFIKDNVVCSVGIAPRNVPPMLDPRPWDSDTIMYMAHLQELKIEKYLNS